VVEQVQAAHEELPDQAARDAGHQLIVAVVATVVCITLATWFAGTGARGAMPARRFLSPGRKRDHLIPIVFDVSPV
jgi:hypothetical protein